MRQPLQMKERKLPVITFKIRNYSYSSEKVAQIWSASLPLRNFTGYYGVAWLLTCLTLYWIYFQYFQRKWAIIPKTTRKQVQILYRRIYFFDRVVMLCVKISDKKFEGTIKLVVNVNNSPLPKVSKGQKIAKLEWYIVLRCLDSKGLILKVWNFCDRVFKAKEFVKSGGKYLCVCVVCNKESEAQYALNTSFIFLAVWVVRFYTSMSSLIRVRQIALLWYVPVCVYL